MVVRNEDCMEQKAVAQISSARGAESFLVLGLQSAKELGEALKVAWTKRCSQPSAAAQKNQPAGTASKSVVSILACSGQRYATPATRKSIDSRVHGTLRVRSPNLRALP